MASLGVCSPLRKEADTRQGSLGTQGSASEPATWPGRAPREGGTVPPRERRVAQSLSHKVEGSERAPPARWPSGSGAGTTPQRVALRSIGGYRCGVPGRRGAGEEPGGLSPGTGAVGRVCLWTRRAPRSLEPRRLPFRSRCQALQAALSPPPRAFSPVRSRARAARGAGRRRREQPVV